MQHPLSLREPSSLPHLPAASLHSELFPFSSSRRSRHPSSPFPSTAPFALCGTGRRLVWPALFSHCFVAVPLSQLCDCVSALAWSWLLVVARSAPFCARSVRTTDAAVAVCPSSAASLLCSLSPLLLSSVPRPLAGCLCSLCLSRAVTATAEQCGREGPDARPGLPSQQAAGSSRAAVGQWCEQKAATDRVSASDADGSSLPDLGACQHSSAHRSSRQRCREAAKQNEPTSAARHEAAAACQRGTASYGVPQRVPAAADGQPPPRSRRAAVLRRLSLSSRQRVPL